MPSIVSPHDLTVSLEQRARSYLHMNCAHCHRRGGGGTGAFELGHELSLGKMDIVDAVPSQGTFGIDEARIVSPGDPYRSVLLYRLIKSGRGHMPPIGTTMVDDEGLRLIHDWIESMGDQTGSAVSNKRFGDEAALLGRSSALPINDVNAWLTSTTDALRLAVACSQEWVSDDARLAIAEVASTNPSSVVRDLFERYLPPDRRVKRLGTSIDPQALLAADGDAKAGQHLYFDSANDVTCRLCHRIGDQGVAVGPDLSSIGTQRSPAEILDSILHPSAKIDEKYQSHLVLTVDGSIVSGVIVDRQPDSITIVDATGKQQTIRDNDIESIKQLNRSVMPDRLLENFTAEQATDLLAFLSEQKDVAPATPPRRRANVWAE